MEVSGNMSPHPMFEAFSLGMTPFTKKGQVEMHPSSALSPLAEI